MARLKNESKVLTALDNTISMFGRRRDNIRDNGQGQYAVDMVDLYETDIADVQRIRDGVLNGDSLKTTARRVTFLDTAVREDVFTEMQRVGLQEALENTGEVSFF
jgi:hypothetical protein